MAYIRETFANGDVVDAARVLNKFDQGIYDLNETIFSDLITTSEKTVDNISVAANSSVTATVDMTLDGFVCLGVIGVYINNASSGGSNSGNVDLRGFYKWSGNVQIYLRNVTTSAAKVKVQVRLLYIKSRNAASAASLSLDE